MTTGLFALLAWPAIALAAGVAAVALPVLVHLLTQQRAQVVEWAAMRFLLAAPRHRRRRPDRWLLLALRALTLVCVLAGLCAATPWAESAWQTLAPGPNEVVLEAPRTHRVLVLDATLSMSARGAGDESRFKAALAAARQAVGSANVGDGFTLIVSGVGTAATVPGPATDPEKVLAALDEVRPTHGANTLAPALSLAAEAVARSPRAFTRKQVVILTDLQRSAWAGLAPGADGSAPDLWARLTPLAEVAVVDCAGADAENVAVADVSLAEPLAWVDAPSAVTASVQNFGRSELKQVRVELAVARPGSPSIAVEQRTIDTLPAGGRATVSFALEGAARFRAPGLHLVTVRLVSPDSLPEDDARTLVVEVRESLPVLLVNGKPAADRLRRASGYFEEALSPGGAGSAANPVRARSLSLAEFADPALGDLSGVECVVLCDVPSLSPAQLARLEAHLKRGGGVVVGLGPNAATNRDLYNRLLYRGGDGLLPGPLGALAELPGGYRLSGDDAAFRRPPLSAFRDDNARAGLSLVPVARYLKLELPAGGAARRLLSYVPADAPKAVPTAAVPGAEGKAEPPDAAVVEFARHRGRVVVVTTSLSADWTDWPVLPTYLPFAQELVRAVASPADRRTLKVGDAIEEFVPVALVGQSATLTRPGGERETVAVVAGDEAGVLRATDTPISGVYRLSRPGAPDAVFAANVPEVPGGEGSESDLARAGELTLGKLGVSLVADATDRSSRAAELGTVVLGPRPRGPGIARVLLLIGLMLMLVELAAAYWAGPGRSAVGRRAAPPAPGFNWPALFAAVLAVVAAGMLAVRGAELFKLDPDELLRPLGVTSLHELAGAPGASAGEGTRVRLETSPVFAPNVRLDRLLTGGLLVGSLLAVVALYRLERRAGRVAWPLALRLLAVAVLVTWMLPQLRAAFDREGYPDLVILIDTSASMATQDGPPTVGDGATPPTPPGESRLDRVRRFLADPKRDLLGKLIDGRRVRVHLYALADQAVPVAEASSADDIPAARAALDKLAPVGESSHLGDGVESVLHGFRGGSLTAIVVFSDGVITSGADWGRAGREAARAGVPLYLVGLGRSREVPDLGLSDLRADDTVLKGDTLILEARLSAKGGALPAGARVPVVLSERVGDKLIERARQTVTVDPSGKPVPVRLSVTPSELGEKTFVLEAAAAPGEVETANNRLERQVLVTDSRKLRVLYLEGYPRYEYRFLKSLLEREAPTAGQKTVELNTVLLDASPGYAEQDKSALRSLPTKAELLLYDVVIVGDLDPESFPRVSQTFADLGEFVKVRGGGLLVVAGPQASPGGYYATPLGELLPVSASENPGKDTTVAVIDGYRPQLTPYGLTHPLFRLAPDEAESAKQWAGLRPLYWSATGYQKKRAAEVLAVHPDRPADTSGDGSTPRGERHPLVVQQFAGAGRVLFFGFDETWRWRFRGAEEQYNQFWLQALRGLARSRVGRPELRTDKQTAYRAGEPIRLTARFPDDAPVPPADVPVKVRVDRRGLKPGALGESQVVQLAKVDGTRATYQTLLTRTPEGDYKFELTDPPPTPPPGSQGVGPPPAKPRAEARVVPPPGERDSPDLDRAGLELAARESRGKFYPLEAADSLSDDLPEGTRVPLNQPVPPVRLWNHALAFALFAGLLTVEWVMRRRARLV